MKRIALYFNSKDDMEMYDRIQKYAYHEGVSLSKAVLQMIRIRDGATNELLNNLEVFVTLFEIMEIEEPRLREVAAKAIEAAKKYQDLVSILGKEE